MANLLNDFLSLFAEHKRPKLLIIGAQKSGTTTLFDLLEAAPEFCGADVKEVGFFIHDMFYRKGESWYLRKFKNCGKTTINFEATPEYLYYPDVPRKIYSFDKAIKFIVVMRDPSARCYSAWNMFRNFNKHSPREIYEKFAQYANPPIREAAKSLLFAENFPTFERAVADDIERYKIKSNDLEPSFVRRGIYCEQIENYLQTFSLSDFLFLEQRELSRPSFVLNKIADFLGVEINEALVKGPVLSNSGIYGKNEENIEDVMSMLKEFYRPHNEKLFNKIGIRYDWNE